MATNPPLARRRRALQAAAELLDQLGADQERPIDVFGAIEQLRLWLVFYPLKNLLGAIVPTGSGGVVLTTERQPSIQRYTAAHEIGHWLLDQDRLALDTEDDIFSPSAAERERIAQLFASYFLMPPPLAHATAARYGVRRDADVTAPQAYLVARDMNVSYEAAVRQMCNLRIVTGRQRDTLLQVPPLKAKQALAHGHRPENGNADIWPVDENAMHHKLDVLLDDEIIVALPENRTTGYRWLDEDALRGLAERRRRPAPPPYAAAVAPTAEPNEREPFPQRTAADVAAALALLPAMVRHPPEDMPAARDTVPKPLRLVDDTYVPGWADLDARGAGSVRRHIAGDTSPSLPPTVLTLPSRIGAAGHSINQSDDLFTPGVGGTGRRWLALRAQIEGHHTYVLRYAAAHDPQAAVAATFVVETMVYPTPELRQRRALASVDFNDQLAAESPLRVETDE